MLTKGLALGILMALLIMSDQEMSRVYSEYQYSVETQSDKETLAALDEQSRHAVTGTVLNGLLCGLMVLSIVINCVSLGQSQTKSKPTKTKAHQKHVYGMLAEDKD